MGIYLKDPAFLFYYQDFLIGTEFMTAEEVGLYIRILCHLADKETLKEEHMLSICKGYVFTKPLQEKFLIDENGFFYNKRLRFEVEKRRQYTESRRKNASKAYAKHMENENGNENIDIDKKGKRIVKEKGKKFIKPTVVEISAYCDERKNGIDPQYFFDSNEAKGWLVGKNQTPMKEWKAVIRTWENNNKQKDKEKEDRYASIV